MAMKLLLSMRECFHFPQRSWTYSGNGFHFTYDGLSFLSPLPLATFSSSSSSHSKEIASHFGVNEKDLYHFSQPLLGHGHFELCGDAKDSISVVDPARYFSFSSYRMTFEFAIGRNRYGLTSGIVAIEDDYC